MNLKLRAAQQPVAGDSGRVGRCWTGALGVRPPGLNRGVRQRVKGFMKQLDHRTLVLRAVASFVALMALFGSSASSQARRSESGSSPEAASSPQIVGRLVFRREDKTLVPIADAIVLMGMGDVSCLEPYQSPKEVKFRPDGGFSFAVDESHSFSRWADIQPDGTTGDPYCTEDVSYGCYRFKAKGCEDLIIRFDPKKVPEQLLVMKCVGRQVPRS